MAGCAKYSKKEIGIIKDNVNKLIGMEVYNCRITDDPSDPKKSTIQDAKYFLYDTVAIKIESDNEYYYITNEQTNLLNIEELKKLLTRKHKGDLFTETLCSKEDYYNTPKGKFEIYLDKIRKDPDLFLSELKDPKAFIGIYDLLSSMRYAITANEQSWRFKYNGNEFEEYINWVWDISELQPLAKPTINLKCFVLSKKEGEEYENNTDECILARRNDNPGIWFNYKKYMPQIKDDEHFREVLGIFNTYYSYYFESGEPVVENTYCNSKKEITTEERNKCEKDVDTFFTQTIAGNAPHCHDKDKKRWNEKLKSSQNYSSALINFFNRLDTYNYNSQLEADFTNKIKDSAEYNIIKEAITEYGKDNFCRIDDWETDLDTLFKSGKIKRRSSVVELN